MSVAHRESHRDLLQMFLFGKRRSVDAIVVAAGRPTENLMPAATLAQAMGCRLVAMCSQGGAIPTEVMDLTAGLGDMRAHPIHIPDDYEHPLLHFATSRVPEAGEGRLGMLSVKRNLGLLLGRMLGWSTVLFLDDDIHGLSRTKVEHAARGLSRFDAVGMAVADWPDNSVVCHANRLGGGPQDVFVSGSALLVDPTRPVGFFPKIYNEDWLFVFPALLDRRVSRVDAVRQVPYDPYADPRRARVEEFGEVIAEGMIDFLRRGLPHALLAESEYWDRFLDSRAAFIDRTYRRVARNVANRPERDPALRALEAADHHRQRVNSTSCAAYYRDWRADLATWRSNLHDVETSGDLEGALSRLGLSGSLVDLVP